MERGDRLELLKRMSLFGESTAETDSCYFEKVLLV